MGKKPPTVTGSDRTVLACQLVVAMLNNGLLRVRKHQSNAVAIDEVGKAVARMYRAVSDAPANSLTRKKRR